MAEPAMRRTTLDEFLDWDDGTDTRYELWSGVIVAMTPPTPMHGRLASRLIRRLGAALDGRAPCDVYTEAGIVRPDRNDTFYVADIVVSCEVLRPDERLLREPILIVEVLSPSTGISDRQIKLADYRSIPSVQEILLIDSQSMFAEVHRRDGERWVTEIVRGGDGTLTLASIPARLGMAEVYQGIPLPEPRAPLAGNTS
jgi:Uma2 family endonuclease